MVTLALTALGILVPFAMVVGAAQLLIPRIAAGRVRERLTEGGGSAKVSIRALPATRLLRNRGERIEVRGRGLEIGLARDAPGRPDPDGLEPAGPGLEPVAGLAALDGFSEVDVELVDFSAGPFAVAAFVLTRTGGGSYAMATQATTTAAGLAAFGLERLRAVPGAGLLGTIAGPALGSREVAVSVEVELITDGGHLRVASGAGTIAGYPAGPLATTIAAAVARRLEIAP